LRVSAKNATEWMRSESLEKRELRVNPILC